MGDKQSIRIVELNEDLEPLGQRTVHLSERAIPEVVPPGRVAAYRLILDQIDLQCIGSVEVYWFEPEEYPAYEKLHYGRHWIEVQIVLRPDSPIDYDDAWDWFIESAAPEIASGLGMESWFFGEGILDRRGQDILFIELDGFETGEWLMITSLAPDDTLEDCCDRIRQIDLIVQSGVNSYSIAD